MSRAWVWTLASLLLAASRAAAQAPATPPVSVDVDPCVPVDRGKLEQLLAIELGTSTGAGAPRAAPTRIWVGCAEQGIVLRLEDELTRKSMMRSLPASSFANAESTRLLALAIAEFVVASWIELNVQPAPAVEPLGPRPSPAARRAAQRVVERHAAPRAHDDSETTLSAALNTALWPSNSALMLGGGMRLTQRPWPLVGFSIGGDVGAASTEVAFGRVELNTASVLLAVVLRARLPPLEIDSGPGGRAGIARIAGDADDRTRAEGKQFSAWYGGPIWLTRVELSAGERLRFGFELELGVTTLPVHGLAGSREAFSIDGAWFGSGLSVGAGF